jgi:hypothetical protein
MQASSERGDVIVLESLKLSMDTTAEPPRLPVPPVPESAMLKPTTAAQRETPETDTPARQTALPL